MPAVLVVELRLQRGDARRDLLLAESGRRPLFQPRSQRNPAGRFTKHLRKRKDPPARAFRLMRRRGLEPPPGYPGPGPQPGASTNSAIGARATASIALDSIGVESVRWGRYLVRTHVRRSRGGAEPHGHRERSDEAPAGDLRLHQALL